MELLSSSACLCEFRHPDNHRSKSPARQGFIFCCSVSQPPLAALAVPGCVGATARNIIIHNNDFANNLGLSMRILEPANLRNTLADTLATASEAYTVAESSFMRLRSLGINNLPRMPGRDKVVAEAVCNWAEKLLAELTLGYGCIGPTKLELGSDISVPTELKQANVNRRFTMGEISWTDYTSDLIASIDFDKLQQELLSAAEGLEEKTYREAANTIASLLHMRKFVRPCDNNPVRRAHTTQFNIRLNQSGSSYDIHDERNIKSLLDYMHVAENDAGFTGVSQCICKIIEEISGLGHNEFIPNRTKLTGSSNATCTFFKSKIVLSLDQTTADSLVAFAKQYCNYELWFEHQ